MKRIVLAILPAMLLSFPVWAADGTNARGPFPDEIKAGELAIRHNSPEAMRYMAWVEHDHALELLRRYRLTKSPEDFKAGLEYARFATEWSPDVATFWRTLAMAALSGPDEKLTREDAQKALVKLVALKPRDRESRRLLADLYVRRENFASAVMQYEFLLETQSSEAADFDTVKMAYSCLKAGQADGCTKVIEGVLDKTPKRAAARIALAILYRGRHEETKANLQLAMVSADSAAGEQVRRAALQLSDYWKKSGPMPKKEAGQ